MNDYLYGELSVIAMKGTEEFSGKVDNYKALEILSNALFALLVFSLVLTPLL